MDDWILLLCAIIFVALAPFAGCLLSGVDRKISARMQGRRGPPLSQPWHDVRKLLAKDNNAPNRFQDFYVACYLIWIIVTGAMFFAGMDLLLVVFTLILAEVFLVLAAYCSGSPFAQVGAQREIYVAMAYEPMVLLMAIGFYLFMGADDGGSFRVIDIAESSDMAIIPMLGIFIGFVIILTMKLRKSPFDLSMSHHAHQDIVRGVATEFSGRTYAMMEVSHWYENIMLLGMVALFFQNGEWTGFILGMVVAILVYLLEIWLDNGFARMKWQTALKTGWVAALILGLGNIAVLLVIA
ncbi:MAG: NADH-quinone oxidoreductase subunit H [Thermoplasmata archaeon]|nr:NADH-quinone oxidoreductase subunit H [Thermoplasmata archaeon]